MTSYFAEENKKARNHTRDRIRTHYNLSNKAASKIVNITLDRAKRGTLEIISSTQQGDNVKHTVLLRTHEYPDVFLVIIKTKSGYRKLVTALHPADTTAQGQTLKALAFKHCTKHMSFYQKIKYSLKQWRK